jgi:hypothetical protein
MMLLLSGASIRSFYSQEVLASEAVALVTTKLECAKLADGAACLLLVPAEPHHAIVNSRGGCLRS